ncbi:right-handed parallel beta-helix repeat-containing protein [Streptomyces parvulus]|uniref:right-handed parallel beta-helix repeat-containing protein n=1 Tax=Streptomyces parvulus TaxID=146923 RepID=UPI001E38A854|nr:right-handed parallel beta-helix repeat-containing protein [Streptomyces parvulus]MCC9154916.1 right-handed parallel beta-helix repeat-containing protein [Streptomyces parvulus]MCE7691239.1 right-handed parallel beta-helix repeat-containing protein [Streptomyces parvulus]
MQYTYGGNPGAVVVTKTGDVVPDFPIQVRVAGTGAAVTALLEADGVTPIGTLRTNSAASDSPGAVRTFKIEDVPAIEYEVTGASGAIRWYEAGREVATQALEKAQGALSTSEGGTVNAPLVAAQGLDVAGGLAVAGGLNTDSAHVSGDMDVAGILTAAGGISLTGMRIFDPRLFGAKGDGIANDAPALQAALTAAKTAGGGWVIVPPGTYRAATLPLRIYRNTRLTLLPGATIVRAAAATLLLNGDSDQTFGGYTGHGTIIIEGGRWEMRATTAGLTASAMCISLGHAENIVVRDVEVRDVPGYHGIEFNAVRGAVVERCRFLGYVDPGGRSTSEAIQLDLAAGSAFFGGFGPYDFTVCENISIKDCYFGASGTAGTTAWPRGVGSHSSIIDRWHRRIRVSGCQFDGMIQVGVRGYSWEDVIVSGCSFVSCGMGVQMRTPDTARTGDTVNTAGVQTNASQNQWGAIITGCTFTGITGYVEGAIHIQGEATGRCINTVISNNVIRTVGGGYSGIRLDYCQRADVIGNLLHGIAGTAISQATVDDTLVSGNKTNDCGASGISANTGVNVHVIGNHIVQCGVNGIHVVAGVNTKLADNFIRGAGRLDGTGFGIRVTTASSKTTITNNTYLKWGSGNEAVNALGITAGNPGTRRYGNDWIGQGRTADVVDNSSPNLSPYDTGA